MSVLLLDLVQIEFMNLDDLSMQVLVLCTQVFVFQCRPGSTCASRRHAHVLHPMLALLLGIVLVGLVLCDTL